jgi:hypothetical protein
MDATANVALLNSWDWAGELELVVFTIAPVMGATANVGFLNCWDWELELAVFPIPPVIRIGLVHERLP